MDKKKKIITLLLLFTIIFTVIGSSFAYLRWQTSTDEQTSVTFTVANEFSCGADGGNELNSNSVLLEPTTCDDSVSAIKREITLKPVIDNEEINIYMDVWLEVVSLDEGLKNSDNFKWVLSNSPMSCSGSSIESEGTFKDLVKDDRVLILDGKTYTSTTDDKHYLYIWLDKEETSTSTMNQQFEFKLNGECGMGMKPKTFTYKQISANYLCNNNSSGTNPIFTYTGNCEVVDDGNDNWKVRFLTSGTFKSVNNTYIDAFLVGGGGGGSTGGGGGGYTNTTFVDVETNHEYQIVIGSGGSSGTNGGNTMAFGAVAEGGKSANGFGDGGNGGSGGGSYVGGSGGSNGSNGVKKDFSPGVGQIKTTCEFEESGCSNKLLYSGGGGASAAYSGTPGSGGAGGGGKGGNVGNSATIRGSDGVANTGGGGGGGYGGGTGGSGIVVIRNTRSQKVEDLPSVGFDFTYTGNYLIIDDGNSNWRIKFLTSGTFTSSADLQIDAFLVGGGGGGSTGGGGGGYTNTISTNIEVNKEYKIIIGSGGGGGANGNDTSGFNYTAKGGNGSSGGAGGNGGSGGGSYVGGSGGSNGSSGVKVDYAAGTGQGGTTCEFRVGGCSAELLYSGGGGASSAYSGTPGSGGTGGGGGGGNVGNSQTVRGGDGTVNTGGGGGGGNGGGSGGSGIVIIRNKR